jgi:hypothetical protein
LHCITLNVPENILQPVSAVNLAGKTAENIEKDKDVKKKHEGGAVESFMQEEFDYDIERTGKTKIPSHP